MQLFENFISILLHYVDGISIFYAWRVICFLNRNLLMFLKYCYKILLAVGSSLHCRKSLLCSFNKIQGPRKVFESGGSNQPSSPFPSFPFFSLPLPLPLFTPSPSPPPFLFHSLPSRSVSSFLDPPTPKSVGGQLTLLTPCFRGP